MQLEGNLFFTYKPTNLGWGGGHFRSENIIQLNLINQAEEVKRMGLHTEIQIHEE
jgi:hypothetical protein